MAARAATQMAKKTTSVHAIEPNQACRTVSIQPSCHTRTVRRTVNVLRAVRAATP